MRERAENKSSANVERRHIAAPSLSVDRRPVTVDQQAFVFVVEIFVGIQIA
jgi:hypothetical protein